MIQFSNDGWLLLREVAAELTSERNVRGGRLESAILVATKPEWMGFEQFRICPLYVRTHARIDADATGLCSFDAFTEEIAAFEERTAMEERNLRWVKRYRPGDAESAAVHLSRAPVLRPLFL